MQAMTRTQAPMTRLTGMRGRIAAPRALAAMLALSLTLAACATLAPRLTPPTLSISEVRLRGGGLRHEQVQLRFHVDNPNDRSISVRSIAVSVELAGMPFATGLSEAPFTLPARGDTDVVLDVTANVDRALLLFAGGLTHRAVAYHLYGELHLQHSLVRTIHFSHDGRVSL
jgi:LEA14-like dessication related protein